MPLAVATARLREALHLLFCLFLCGKEPLGGMLMAGSHQDPRLWPEFTLLELQGRQIEIA